MLPQKFSLASTAQHDHEQPRKILFWLNKNNLIYGRITMKKSHLLGAGSSFPTSDYAHMEQYQDWLKTQQLTAITPTNTAKFVSD